MIKNFQEFREGEKKKKKSYRKGYHKYLYMLGVNVTLTIWSWFKGEKFKLTHTVMFRI